MSTPEHDDPLTDVETIVVGAGFAGVGLGIQLVRAGRTSFVILERADDVGGTWRDNTYPGVACDVPSHLYSFSFHPKADWSRVFSPGAEIWQYLRDAARDEGVLPHVRLGADMRTCRWDPQARRWIVHTSSGTYTGRFLVLAAGHLADEKLPDIPGVESFPGDLFHSARWRHDRPLAGKRVGVVGSGASAIQIVPSIVDDVSELVIFQRSAPWLMPRRDRAYSDAEKRMFQRDPASRVSVRTEWFWNLEFNYAARRRLEPFFSGAKAVARAHLASQVPDPDLRHKLTPDYELGCKRVLISSDFYPAVAKDNVTLEPSALSRVDGSSAISAAGNSYELDTLVFATGFEAADPPFAANVYGKDGRSLAEHWAGGMHALQSAGVPGFPNMFIINGPNTGLGHNSVVYMIESQLRYVLGAMDYADQHALATLEPDAGAERTYLAEVRQRSEGTVWLEGGCRSWYVDPGSGELTIIWPDFAHVFRDRNSVFEPSGYAVTGAY
ncbi:NAD(P)/FAD-dependent oxidoreductase [Amycolatopsis sp. GM8]|uniref:flavin-containing monooxygenase n=1 Tax=Amycolatopsis sp. GM8 TaxID=2896530 RepID=UPI001F1D6C54|nr:NAD(P)/FAD-dependent oxidoreductase [Amycolatopsis sp. GM8]